MFARACDQEYSIFTHSSTGESLVRTTAYSLPENLHGHIDVVQPTTHFSGTKALKSTLRFSKNQHPFIDATAPPINVPSASGGQVDASCNETITITCLLQLYNAVGFTASATNGNQIGITGYLEQFANREDLQTFYSRQRPEAVGSSFKFVSINGGCRLLWNRNVKRSNATSPSYRATQAAKITKALQRQEMKLIWVRRGLGNVCMYVSARDSFSYRRRVCLRHFVPDSLNILVYRRKPSFHPRHWDSHRH